MDLNVGKEVTALRRMTLSELRRRFAEVFGEPTQARHKDWLVKRIAWRLQARAEGDLSERARKRAAELANDADLRLAPPRAAKITTPSDGRTATASVPARPDGRLPPPGTLLTRPYKGRRIEVRILPKGFEYEGEVYRSLSAVAKAVTGSHCNGFHFFQLTNTNRGDA
jgi:hypothetical protein